MEGFMKIIKEKCTTGEIGKPEDVAESYLWILFIAGVRKPTRLTMM